MNDPRRRLAIKGKALTPDERESDSSEVVSTACRKEVRQLFAPARGRQTAEA
jgi:hypothetical protein